MLLSNDLSGFIPPDIGNCTSLYRLRLNHNRLVGNIAPKIENLKSLNFLDMSNNHLYGEIPPTLYGSQNVEFLDLHSNSLTGVLDLSHNKLSGNLVALSDLENLVSLNVCFNGLSGELPNTPFSHNLPLSDLAKNQGLYIAGVVITPDDKGHARSAMKFIMSILLSTNAILVLLTIYVLIRTHMANKGKAEWETIYDVILGVAHALAYLHHDCLPAIIHGDVKAMNVLLGPGYQPYVADFGLPIIEKSDVYSFGMALLEVLPGRHPLDPTLPGGAHLVQWVRNHLSSKGDPSDILDTKLRGRVDPTMHEMLQTLAVSFLCVSNKVDERPTMKDVVTMLKEIRPLEKGRP
ncbi:hypothetical protein JHK87_043390 [Glycine soja]|nr:hypothetical protein JHK87_043390 [Glycine soja]